MLVLRVFAARIARRVRAALPATRTTYVSERVAEYRGYWSEAASILGAEFRDVLPGVWDVRLGERRTRLINFVTQCDDPVILRLAGDKPYGYRLALAGGVPVPEHCVVTLSTLSEAERFLDRVGAPVVVKPAADSSSGLGVSTGVRNHRDLAAAAALASLYSDRILVERMVPGESYRILYVAGTAVHAVRRRGVRVTGDGRRSVAELLDPDLRTLLESDPMTVRTLSAQQLRLDTVLLVGQEALVRGLPAGTSAGTELRTVYDESVLDSCGPELLREGAEVVRRLGSELAGVDVITTAPAVSLREAGGAFIEINTTPGIHHHYVGAHAGGTCPVAVPVLEYLLARRPPSHGEPTSEETVARIDPAPSAARALADSIQ